MVIAEYSDKTISFRPTKEQMESIRELAEERAEGEDKDPDLSSAVREIVDCGIKNL